MAAKYANRGDRGSGHSPKAPHLVVALAYDGLCTFEFGCAVELFALSRPELGVRWYQFAVCSTERRLLRAVGGFEMRAPHSLADLIANGASELFKQVFGDIGAHARSAFGVAQIPLGSCVEIELIAEISDEHA